MAEEKFEPIEYSPEEIREIRERMSQTVDARDLARRMIEARTRRPDAWADDIAKRFGFDPRQSLTEFEQFDAGDGHDVADEPEVHALRHVPMDHWTPNDVCLMLAYGIGVECALWLALDILSREPMIEARHFEGDLLLVAAQTLASGEAKDFGDADRAPALLRAALDDAHRDIWARFAVQADEQGLSDAEREEHRTRLSRGFAVREPGPFRATGRRLNRLAEALCMLDAPQVLATAAAEMVYAYYRPRRGLEIVPPADLADPEIRAHLEHEDTFYFRRETRFEIVAAEAGGVRLRHFSESAIENHHGLWFENEDAATGYAVDAFGVPPGAWEATPAPERD